MIAVGRVPHAGSPLRALLLRLLVTAGFLVVAWLLSALTASAASAGTRTESSGGLLGGTDLGAVVGSLGQTVTGTVTGVTDTVSDLTGTVTGVVQTVTDTVQTVTGAVTGTDPVAGTAAPVHQPSTPVRGATGRTQATPAASTAVRSRAQTTRPRHHPARQHLAVRHPVRTPPFATAVTPPHRPSTTGAVPARHRVELPVPPVPEAPPPVPAAPGASVSTGHGAAGHSKNGHAVLASGTVHTPHPANAAANGQPVAAHRADPGLPVTSPD